MTDQRTSPNERLREAILTSGLGVDDAAERLGVDRKTVERWISGRIPYRRHQYALASLLGADVAYLWPDGSDPQRVVDLGRAEMVAFYPHRSVVPGEVWDRLFEGVSRQLDILIYAGFWLSEDPEFRHLVRKKASAGVRIRVAIGDPDSEEVRRRGHEEGIGDAVPAKVRNTLINYAELFDVPGVEFRLHSTTLYNSLYRADDEMLVNSHIHGLSAYLAPVIHLRHLSGAELFATYQACFERIWDSARPVTAADTARVA